MAVGQCALLQLAAQLAFILAMLYRDVHDQQRCSRDQPQSLVLAEAVPSPFDRKLYLSIRFDVAFEQLQARYDSKAQQRSGEAQADLAAAEAKADNGNEPKSRRGRDSLDQIFAFEDRAPRR